jgi:hypothetical protein
LARPAVVATLQSFTSSGKIFWQFPSGYTDFVMGPIVSRNHYAAFIEAVLPIAVYKALGRRGQSLLCATIAAALSASVIASASRAGSILATAEILVVVAGLQWARGGATGRAAGLSLLRMAVLFGAFTAVVGWQRVWDRFWVPDPMALRREFAISSLHMISAHPWFGTDLGTWATVYPHYAIVDVGVFANSAAHFTGRHSCFRKPLSSETIGYDTAPRIAAGIALLPQIPPGTSRAEPPGSLCAGFRFPSILHCPCPVFARDFWGDLGVDGIW